MKTEEEVDEKLPESVLAKYRKVCPKCHEEGLVPARHNECLSCIAKFQNLKSWETLCLQCGAVEEHMPEGHRICLGCLSENVGRANDEFVLTLNDEQRRMLKEVDAWSDAKTSFITLMS